MALGVKTSMDILSDILSEPYLTPCNIQDFKLKLYPPTVMVIPFSLLWRVSLPLRKVLALGGIFSLSVLIIVASISRVALISSTKFADESWYYVGSAVEMATGNLLPWSSRLVLADSQALAIIVACLSSYRALFTSSTKSQHHRRLHSYHGEVPDGPERHDLRRFGFSKIDRPLASNADTGRNADHKWTFSGKSAGQHYEGHTAGASRAAKFKALLPIDRQVYLHSEASVHHPEAPQPVAIRSVV